MHANASGCCAVVKVAKRCREPHWGAIKPIDAHTSEFRTGDDDLRWLALRIAMLGVDFEVREPTELADHVRALAARFDRAAGSPGGGTVLRP